MVVYKLKSAHKMSPVPPWTERIKLDEAIDHLCTCTKLMYYMCISHPSSMQKQDRTTTFQSAGLHAVSGEVGKEVYS